MTPAELRAAGFSDLVPILEERPHLGPIVARILRGPIVRVDPIRAAAELRAAVAGVKADAARRELDAWRERMADAPDDLIARRRVAALVAVVHAAERSGLVPPRVPLGQPAPEPKERKLVPFRPRRWS